jgi:hypothetical protein
MSEDEFAAAAMMLPEAIESGHQGSRDWRIRKKIFATYDAGKGLAGLKLMPEQQGLLMAASPAFFPANGSWGAKGWTKATIAEAREVDLIAALKMSWINTAPKTFAQLLENET